MAAIIDMPKENIVKGAVKIVNQTGWNSLNARGLAKELKISTKPLYRIYKSMDEIKDDVYKEIYRQYDEFINSRIDNKKALLTLCIAYVEFAQEYKNLFISLFLSNNLKWKDINNVLDEKWNQSTIINLVNKQGLTFNAAKELFMNMWLYANGFATLVATNDIKVDSKDILYRIVKYYKEITK
jgi:AcrR family transcriptional regulator